MDMTLWYLVFPSNHSLHYCPKGLLCRDLKKTMCVTCMMYDVCVSIALALGLDIWPCFAAWTSRLRFRQMSPCLSFGPKMWRFTFDKPVFSGSKKVQKSDKSENFWISDPEMCRFRSSKPVLGDSNWIGTSGHLPCGCNLVSNTKRVRDIPVEMST